MRLHHLLALFVLGVSGLWSSPASAGEKLFQLDLPNQLHVFVANGEIWDYKKSDNPDLFLFDDPVDFSGRLTVFCPDIDEKVTKIRFTGPNGLKEESPHNTWHDASMAVYWKPKLEQVLAGQNQVNLLIEWWCKPLVGKSDKISVNAPILMTVHNNPSDLHAHSHASAWTHFCPPGYEVKEHGVQYGYGQTEITSGSFQRECRKVNPLNVKPKAGSKNKPKKTPEVVDMEMYAWTLAKARDTKATLNAAGIDTVYDLAKTDLANITSLVGIKGGKAVRASALRAIGKSSIVDPNWIFDEYFLIDPSWFVNPRIRGTKGAHKKIDAAQSKLIKLQKSGIFTVRQLADASPTAVASLLSAPKSEATAIIDAAKIKALHQGNGRALKIKADWVLHPMWLVDPGLLPSVNVVRSQAALKAAGPTVTVKPRPDFGKVPPSTTPPPGAKVTPGGRKVPKAQVNQSNKPKAPGSRRGKRGRDRRPTPKAARGSRGTSSGGKKGRGSRGTSSGDKEGRGSRGSSSDGKTGEGSRGTGGR